MSTTTTYNYAFDSFTSAFNKTQFVDYARQNLIYPTDADNIECLLKGVRKTKKLRDLSTTLLAALSPYLDELYHRLLAAERDVQLYPNFNTAALVEIGDLIATIPAPAPAPAPTAPAWTVDSLLAYFHSIIGDRELHKLVVRSIGNAAIMSALNLQIADALRERAALAANQPFDPNPDTSAYALSVTLYRYSSDVLADSISRYDLPMSLDGAAALLITPRTTSETILAMISDASGVSAEILSLMARQSAESRIARVKSVLPDVMRTVSNDLQHIYPVVMPNELLAYTVSLRFIRALAKAKVSVLKTATSTGRLDQLGLFTIADAAFKAIVAFASDYENYEVLAAIPEDRQLAAVAEEYRRVMPVR